MYGITSLLASLALGTLTSAIKVTSPDSSTLWSSGTSGQTVSWEAVSTDATSFVIQLVNQAGFLANSPVTLVENQSTGSHNTVNSATVTFPSGTWPTGTAFQVNLMTSTQSNAAILAQSQQFNISGSAAAGAGPAASSTTSATGLAPTTMTMMSTTAAASSAVTLTSMVPAGSTSNSSGDASGGIPNAVTTTASGSSTVFSIPAIATILLSAAGFAGLLL